MDIAIIENEWSHSLNSFIQTKFNGIEVTVFQNVNNFLDRKQNVDYIYMNYDTYINCEQDKRLAKYIKYLICVCDHKEGKLPLNTDKVRMIEAHELEDITVANIRDYIKKEERITTISKKRKDSYLIMLITVSCLFLLSVVDRSGNFSSIVYLSCLLAGGCIDVYYTMKIENEKISFKKLCMYFLLAILSFAIVFWDDIVAVIQNL